MEKTLSNFLIKELTQLNSRVDNYKSMSTNSKTLNDEREFYQFMIPVLEDSIKKIQTKVNKEKQSNKKLRFINHEQ